MRFLELYRAQQLPIFQNVMYPTQRDATLCLKGDLVLVQDLETGLIFNQAFRADLMVYDADYQNEQAVSEAFRSHLQDVEKIMSDHFKGERLFELGCGKGYFLECLKQSGFNIRGMDPSYEGESPLITKAPFTSTTELSADAFILRHVLEHIPDPVNFLMAVCAAAGGTGKIYIEVPCFDWICKRRAWFDVFYEHVNYFRVSDFHAIFAKVYESGHLFGGQYLYIVADLATIKVPRVVEQCSFPEDFLASMSNFSAQIKVNKSTSSGFSNVVWGGASKGVIFSLFMQQLGVAPDFAVDINPSKQGKYLAATGLEVVPPEQLIARAKPGSTIFVMNQNYLAEIRQATLNQYNYIAVDHEKF